MLVALVAIALAADFAEERAPGHAFAPMSRGPASLMNHKEVAFLGTEGALFRHTEKLQGPIATTIELLGERPERAGDVFVLRAGLRATESLTDVEFRWSLPAGVELVNGERRGRIAVLGPEQPAAVELTLKTLTGDNHQIHLITSAQRDGSRFASSVQYNSLLEPILHAGRKALSKSTRQSVPKVVQ